MVQLNECPVYLIDEEIEPTEQIIAHLLSLRDSPEDDVQEDADIVYTSEIDDQPEYPSESEFEGIGSIDVHLPALPGIQITHPYGHR